MKRWEQLLRESRVERNLELLRLTMKTGRPPLPEAERRSVQVGVRFTEAEAARLEQEAGPAGVSELIRRKALNEAHAEAVGWGSTTHIFNKQPDGSWLCKETGEVRTDEQMKPCGHLYKEPV